MSRRSTIRTGGTVTSAVDSAGRSAVGSTAGIAALALALAGCGSATAPRGAEAAPVAAQPAAAQHAAAAPQGGHAGHAAAGHLPVRAPQVREGLEMLLGQHSTLAVRLMRAQVRPTGDFAEATAAVLGRNTEELTAAVGQAYDPAAGARFRELWVTHITALGSYAAALERKDAAGQRQAKAMLDRYNRDYGAAISGLTGGELPVADVTAGVKEHVDTLLAAVDAYAGQDWPRAYELEREAYRHMFSTAKGLAGATVSTTPGELPAGFDAPPARLRSALGMLLGEHMELTVDATRAAVSGAPELAAAQQALDANSREIGEAFASVFGATEAARLAALWGDHVDAVVAFAVATRDKDDAGQQKARADLERFAAALGTGLRTLARGKVEAAAATKALDQHDAHLLEAITAYASGDYRRAHDVSYAGFQHMFPIAATLARAVEGHVGARLPVGGAATGHGGTAQRRR